jgi:hypothetical protein
VSTRITPVPAAVAAPSRRRRQFGFAAAQTSQPTRALPFDQRLKGFTDEDRLLLHAGESLRFGHKVVIEGKGRAHHWNLHNRGTIKASLDALSQRAGVDKMASLFIDST